MRRKVSADALNTVFDFDHVLTVLPGNVVDDGPAGLYAPEVSQDDAGQVFGTDGWEPLDGYSGQHGYAGPVMHPSEYIGGGLARDILAEPGVYVAVVVAALGSDDEQDDETFTDADAGWMVLRWTGEPTSRCVLCGDPVDYCQGHGESGSDVWEMHDEGEHARCHPAAECVPS